MSVKEASCESTAVQERASLRIRSHRITSPQISPSIPSETDYPGLSQTQRMITGSPLGHCSPCPMHGNTRAEQGGWEGTPVTVSDTDTQTICLTLSLLATVSIFLDFPQQFSYFSSSIHSSYIKSYRLSPPQTCLPLSFRCSHFPFLTLSHMCIGSPSPPSGLFIKYTVDTNTAQAHLKT